MKTAYAFASLSVLLLFGCSSTSSTTASREGSAGRGGAYDAYPGSGGDEGGSASPEEAAAGNAGGVQAGQLTAGVWDDNLNFDFFSKYVEKTKGFPGLVPFSNEERAAARDRALSPRTPKNELDIAFVFDTTGSMGDELTYLQAETSGVVASIREKFPNVVPRLALVVYRDHGDAYLKNAFDFTADVAAYDAVLKGQSVNGGGDYEEAVQEGLSAASALSWRPGEVARIAFWIADAPHHVDDAQATRTAIDAIAQKGVRIYPVAASGVDERMENTMRSAAQYTGGRYLFLTDDSGIGNAHKEPSIPCYRVTRFDRAMVRMVESELTGQRVEPPAEEVLRTVGNPVDGKCSLDDGEQVELF